MNSLLHKFRDAAISKALQAHCRLYGYRIGPVNSEADIPAHDKLIQKAFYEAGLLDAQDTPLAPDAPGSEIQRFLAWYGKDAVGAVSIVQNETRLPLQRFFHIKLPDDVPRKDIVEITRFGIDSRHRTMPLTVSLGMLDQAVRHAQRMDARWMVWCGPSLFLWGFRSFFRETRMVKELEPLPEHHEARKGRESYFEPHRAIKIVMMKLDSIDRTRAAKLFLKRRFGKGARKANPRSSRP